MEQEVIKIIGNQFPLLLAKVHEQALKESDARHRFDKLVNFVEDVFRYLSLIGFAYWHHYEIKSSDALDWNRSNLVRPSIGKWLGFLQAIEDVLVNNDYSFYDPPLRQKFPDSSLVDLANCIIPFIEGAGKSPNEIKKILDLIVRLRNVDEHQFPLTAAEAKSIIDPFQVGLYSWLKDINVLQEYHLVYIKWVDQDESNYMYIGTNLNKGLISSTLFRISQEKPVEPGLLYLKTEEDFIPLYPFITFDENNQRIYIYNGISGKRKFKPGSLTLHCPYSDEPNPDRSSLLKKLDVDPEVVIGTKKSSLDPIKQLRELLQFFKQHPEENQGNEVTDLIDQFLSELPQDEQKSFNTMLFGLANQGLLDYMVSDEKEKQIVLTEKGKGIISSISEDVVLNADDRYEISSLVEVTTPSDWNEIALWGVHGSGKTWLIQALNKNLAWCNNNQQSFDYFLTDYEGIALKTKLPNNEPTLGPVDYLIRFARKGRKQTSGYQISSHTHLINIHDDKGENLVDALVNPQNQPLAYYTLKQSAFVIAVLDHTHVYHKDIGKQSDWQELYYEYLRALCKIMVEENTNVNNRYLALCLTKADLLPRVFEPWRAIEIYFGKNTFDLLQSYQSKFNMKPFLTSATGIYQEGNNIVPNFDKNLNKIKDENLWQPHNVVAPFFWLFENIERQRLSMGNWLSRRRIKLYKPYPTEGLSPGEEYFLRK